MILSIYFLIQIIYVFMNPAFVKIIKVPPIMPLIPYLDKIFSINWMPPFYFTYWIIAIALVAIFHEGFHGIFARLYNIKIKSTGFGFLGPFLAFFVEQDEKSMEKAKIKSQLAVLSAGVFANVLLSILFFILMIGFFSLAYNPAGVIFNDYSYSVVPASMLLGTEAIANNFSILNETLKVDGLNLTKIKLGDYNYYISDTFFSTKFITNPEEVPVKLYHDEPAIKNELKGAIIEVNGFKVESSLDISKALMNEKPGEIVNVKTKYQTNNNQIEGLDYDFNLGFDYSNPNIPKLGIATIKAETSNTLKTWLYKLFNSFKDPNVYYEANANPDFTLFIYNLLWWIFMINISVAICNMIPLGIFDGGRFFYLTILAITGRKKIAKWTFKGITWLLLAVIVLMMVLYFMGIF